MPEVVAFAPHDATLGRSAMVTTEVPGVPLARTDAGVDLRSVLRAAGRDLAMINGLAVDGFGWIRRDAPAAGRLAAVLSTHRAFALREPPERLRRLRGVLLDDTVRAICRAVTDRDAWIDAEQARLAHLDLDATHDFQHEGRYAGIIDFGEIRGADRHDALGHFALHDGETLPRPVLPFLLEGYRDVVPLSAEEERRLHLWAVLIGVRTLARSLNRPRGAYPEHLTGAIRRNLAILRARDGARPPGSPRPAAHGPPARNASPPSRV